MTLRRQAENLWTAEHTMKMPGGVPFPARMTVVRLPDGSVSLISPVPLSDALAAEIAALGPNLYHHLYLAGAKAHFPSAQIMGPNGLAAKQPKLAIADLSLEGPPFRGALEALSIDGTPKLKETVFFHAPSRSLIVCDLAF